METTNKMDSYKYMVDIRCMTYNHEAYITDAMNGFVIQKTNFPFLAIIVDDGGDALIYYAP